MGAKRKAAVASGLSSPRKQKKVKTVNETNALIQGLHDSLFMDTEDVPNEIRCDLNNAIHPLFARDRFPKCDYSNIEVPARLATKLLEADSLVPYFYTAMTKEPVSTGLPAPGQDEKFAYSVPPAGDEDTQDHRNRRLTRQVRDLVELHLDHLAQMVRFEKVDVNETGWMTKPTRDATLRHATFRGGRGSKIRFHRSVYQELSTETKKTDAERDWPLLRTLQFNFAVSMVHEVCHALFNAFYGDVAWEPFFAGAKVSEAGYEAEVRLFDGHLTRLFEEDDGVNTTLLYTKPARGRTPEKKSRLQGMMVMWDWPQAGIVAEYDRHKYTIDHYPDSMPAKDLAWRLPLDYLAQLFTNAFWNRVANDVTLLRPPRNLGYFFIRDAQGYHPQRITQNLMPKGKTHKSPRDGYNNVITRK